MEQPSYSGVVTGKVIRGGKPLANANVTLEDELQQQYEPVFTDQTGVYVLSGVKPGKYKLLVWLPGIEPNRTDVVAGPGVTNVPDVNLYEKPGATIASSMPIASPTATTAEEITADEARAFVKNYWTVREQGSLDLLMEAYAPEVDYYTDGVKSQGDILKDLKNYNDYYARRTFELGAIDVIRRRDDAIDTIRVRFPFHYRLSGKKSASGSSTETWVLRKIDGKLQIIDCKAKVVRD